MNEYRFQSHFSPFQIKMAAGGHLARGHLSLLHRRPFWMNEYRFQSHFSPFQIKMAAGGHFGSPIWAILDDRKSLSIAFLAISDQYTTLIFLICFSKWPLAVILEVRFAPKTIGFFHYVLSMSMPNMKLIGEFMTQFYTKEAILFFRLMPKIIWFL